MTNLAETKVKKRVEARLSQRPSPTSKEGIKDDQSSAADDPQAPQYPWTTGLTKAMGPTWRKEAVMRFLADYSLQSDAMSESLKFLPKPSDYSSLCPHLKEALHAAAFANQGNQLGSEWMVTEGGLAYGRALALLVGIMEKKAANDSTLAATILLGMYEVSSVISVCGFRFNLDQD